jgi:hypothetical protein
MISQVNVTNWGNEEPQANRFLRDEKFNKGQGNQDKKVHVMYAYDRRGRLEK